MSTPARDAAAPAAQAAFAYRAIPIDECHDSLVAIPPESFSLTNPHPYVALGAPYAGASPWTLRRRVLAALLQAQSDLGTRRLGWRLRLFDAYRPVSVQAFMVWREFRRQAELTGRSLAAYDGPTELEKRDPELYRTLSVKVFEFWGMPSNDPRTPPPHSTGAAVDLTLEDSHGDEVDMGGVIDETTERSYPDHYANAAAPPMRGFHEHRTLLDEVMCAAGFVRHPNEWWHYSLGDQMWAWTRGESVAVYGRAG